MVTIQLPGPFKNSLPLLLSLRKPIYQITIPDEIRNAWSEQEYESDRMRMQSAQVHIDAFSMLLCIATSRLGR